MVLQRIHVSSKLVEADGSTVMLGWHLPISTPALYAIKGRVCSALLIRYLFLFYQFKSGIFYFIMNCIVEKILSTTLYFQFVTQASKHPVAAQLILLCNCPNHGHILVSHSLVIRLNNCHQVNLTRHLNISHLILRFSFWFPYKKMRSLYISRQ